MNKHVTIQAILIQETDKGRQVQPVDFHESTWVPKFHDKDPDVGMLYVPEWLAIDRGWVEIPDPDPFNGYFDAFFEWLLSYKKVATENKPLAKRNSSVENH